ncbi:high-affinity methionine permease [Sphaerosporella brunnea]|uniref:High-affinity methionine permease n=1 Tax=Sphaerosporella brunnea TaxID=1250544 RepID=A0A5J5F3A4_9PEZI|nr:high-affinity methionine permease [Sphaerosporella brunnea]
MTEQEEAGKAGSDATAAEPLTAAPAYTTDDEQTFEFEDSRKLGITSSVFLILNKMIGTGIFSTPSGIFKATGNAGVCIILWIVGGIITFTGLSVYLEFGLAIPRSGGEKNYLERAYQRPKYLATCIFLSQMVLLGFSSGNSLAFGQYVLFASGSEAPDGWKARGIAIACITFACLLHSTLPRWGMRLFNILGVFKVGILAFIVFSGFAALGGHLKIPKPDTLQHAFRWYIFEGTGGAYNYATALLRIVYSYKGWENANYVLGEVRHPRRTLAIAAPLAIGGTMALYVLANVAYFAAIPAEEMQNSGVIVAGIFFKNVFGASAGVRALPAFVALSNLGNVLAVSFAHSRVNQEFAKEGILPFPKFWASNKPFNAPAASLFLHWLVSVIFLVAPPAGDAYGFIVDLYTYPGAWINTFVALGLLYLQFSPRQKWTSPFHSYVPFTVIFLLSNVFLVIVPFIPPSRNTSSYPHYVFPLVGVGVLLLGVAYWLVWAKLWPKLGGYRVVAERVVLDANEDGAGQEVIRYRKVKIA